MPPSVKDCKEIWSAGENGRRILKKLEFQDVYPPRTGTAPTRGFQAVFSGSTVLQSTVLQRCQQPSQAHQVTILAHSISVRHSPGTRVRWNSQEGLLRHRIAEDSYRHCRNDLMRTRGRGLRHTNDAGHYTFVKVREPELLVGSRRRLGNRYRPISRMCASAVIRFWPS